MGKDRTWVYVCAEIRRFREFASNKKKKTWKRTSLTWFFFHSLVYSELLRHSRSHSRVMLCWRVRNIKMAQWPCDHVTRVQVLARSTFFRFLNLFFELESNHAYRRVFRNSVDWKNGHRGGGSAHSQINYCRPRLFIKRDKLPVMRTFRKLIRAIEHNLAIKFASSRTVRSVKFQRGCWLSTWGAI